MTRAQIEFILSWFVIGVVLAAFWICLAVYAFSGMKQ